MLVGPGGVTFGCVYDSVNGVVADEIPWIDRFAILIAHQLGRVDRIYSAVAARRSTVEQVLIKFDALVVFGSRTGRGGRASGAAARQPIAGSVLRRVERAVVSHVVVN